MIAYVFIAVGLAAILFGAPALVGPARQAAARRAAARARRDADAEQAKQETAAAQQALTRLWTNHPETAGVGETLSYRARIQGELLQESLEQGRKLTQRDEVAQHRRLHIRDGNPVTTGYRLRVLMGLALFLIVSALAIGLDYLIFRGLHPTGTLLLPLALACLAVIGITAGSVLFLDANRHHLVPATATPYVRRVVPLGGAMLAIGIAVYMMMIAPYRSYPAGEARIHQAQLQLASDQSETTANGGSSSQVIAADKQALTRARTDLAQAQRVDRWSAGVLAILDIPLSAAAFLGAELLLLDLAVFRRELARRQSQRADDALQRADNAFIDALHQLLTRHGHLNADEVIPQIIARVHRLGTGTGSPSIGRQSAIAGQPGSASGQAADPAGGADPNGQPGPSARGTGSMENPAAGGRGGSRQAFPPSGMPQPPGSGPVTGPGSHQAGSAPPVTVIHPAAGGMAPGTGSGNGIPSGANGGPISGVTVINPNGGPSQSGARHVSGQPGPQVGRPNGGAMTAPAELSAEEFDMTA